jgi:starch phosphorylase
MARIRESMARLTAYFSSNRTVRQYTEQYYIPAAAAFRERAADRGAPAVELVNGLRDVARKWKNLRFGEVAVTTDESEHLFEVQVYLHGLSPDDVRVELYAEGTDAGDPVRLEMTCGPKLVGAENGYVYFARASAARTAADYTARVIPHLAGSMIPLEAAHILWQR